MEVHEKYGHFGASKMYQVLRPNYQINRMYCQIKKFLKTCELCQKSKISNKCARGPTISTIPEGPRQIIEESRFRDNHQTDKRKIYTHRWLIPLFTHRQWNTVPQQDLGENND